MEQNCSDLEDGEIADSDGEDVQASGEPQRFCAAASSLAYKPRVDPNAARSSKVMNYSDDESSSEEEENDSSPCKMKRRRPPPRMAQSLFQNPLLAEGQSKRNNIWGAVLEEQTLTTVVSNVGVGKKMDKSRDVESYDFTKALEDTRPEVSEMRDDMDSDKDRNEVETNLGDFESFGTGPKARKRLSVKTRLGSRGSTSSEADSDRSSDSKTAVQTRDNKPFHRHTRQGMKRGYHSDKQREKELRSVKERLGVRSFDLSKDHPHIKASCSDPTEVVVEELMRILDEPESQRTLMTDLVEAMGTQRSLELLHITEDIENTGGLMTMSGDRRRTPGGVYLYLVKEDTGPYSEAVAAIFKENQKQFYKKIKEEKKAARKLKQPRKSENKRAESGGRSQESHMTCDDDVTNAANDDDDLFNYTPEVELDVT